MKNYIKGNYKRSIFKSDNGYIIGLFKVKETNDETLNDYVNKTITFTGYFPDLNEDDTYIFYGELIEHPRYGTQYQVNESERVKPEDKDGIVEFLSSDLFNGIGEKMAKKIVEKLGDSTLDKIIEDPSCLLMVPKLSQKKADHIYEVLLRYEESHKIVVYLTELGFSMKDALLIYNTYRSNTISYIEHNIYDINNDIKEISFIKLDKIAYKLEIPYDDIRRIKAALFYTISYLTNYSGNTYLSFETIKINLLNYLKFPINDEDLHQYLVELGDEDKIIIIDDKYYLKEIYESEENIINKFRILKHIPKTSLESIKKSILDLEKESNISYNQEQKDAIVSALSNNLTIITGGPGTGKTTIIKAIVKLYTIMNNLSYNQITEDISLLAPTGRASKRMAEVSVIPATTIHRFLKWNKETNEFAVNEYNKNGSKLVIVDEVSMIDTLLFDSLLKGLNDNIKLVLVGDYHQLPSVGPGNILKDLIESKSINTIILKQLYRTDEDSYITSLAQKIKDNELDETFLKEYSDYTFIETQPHLIKEQIKNTCLSLLEDNVDIKDIQVMAPIYRGENGIDSLNKELQTIFNPPSLNKKEITYGDVILRERDKVLQLVNMPDENVYNGDIGFIFEIKRSLTSKEIEVYINFDGNIVKYGHKDLINIKHGYAISIHKSQGSEFNNVIIPVCSSYYRMLYNKLIYTGITRARKKLFIIGEQNAFIRSVKNQIDNDRNTDLKDKLMYNL